MKNLVRKTVAPSHPAKFEPDAQKRARGRASDSGPLAVCNAWLSSGGGERLSIDPRTGRNRYGAPMGAESTEIWFSSASACPATARGFDAARALYERATGSGLPLPDLFDDIRARLGALFAPPGTEIALAGSGAEAELLVLCAARSLSSRPLASIVVTPDEAGEDFCLAADGRHFLDSAPFAESVARGERLQGLETFDRKLIGVALRDRHGLKRDPLEVDALVARRVDEAVAEGRDVLLHVLDCSRTGLSGPSRACAAALALAHPGRVLVAVDARQLRCARDEIRADLEAGFLVMLTGSKFAGGPAFSGAVLFPPALLQRLETFDLPAGLRAYSSALDWPLGLRERMAGDFSSLANLGLAMRWECALAELESYYAIDIETRQRIGARFALELHAHLAASPHLRLIDCDWRESLNARRIFPIVAFDDRGKPFAAEKLHKALAEPWTRKKARARDERPIHLGLPVQIGAMKSLRLALSAPQVSAVAERLAAGQSFDAAFHPLSDDLSETFGRWNELTARDA